MQFVARIVCSYSLLILICSAFYAQNNATIPYYTNSTVAGGDSYISIVVVRGVNPNLFGERYGGPLSEVLNRRG